MEKEGGELVPGGAYVILSSERGVGWEWDGLSLVGEAYLSGSYILLRLCALHMKSPWTQ